MIEAKEAPVSFPATVVRVIDKYKVVINRGAKHGIQKDQRFLVYHLEPDPIKDLETGHDLGQLEIVKGTGIATHVQENITTLSSNRKGPAEQRVVKRRNPFLFGPGEEEKITIPGEIEPFEDVTDGDKAKPI